MILTIVYTNIVLKTIIYKITYYFNILNKKSDEKRNEE